MKKISILIPALFAIFTSFAQSAFEGKIVMRAENVSKGDVSDITWYMKNGQHLLSYVNSGTSGNNTYSLLSKEGKLQMVNERGRVDIPGNSVKQPDYNFTVYKLLNKEGGKTINEFNCVKYTIENDNKVAEYWIADDPDLHASDFPPFMAQALLAVSEKLQAGGIPIQIKISERSGKTLYLQTISYIMPCKVADEKFK